MPIIIQIRTLALLATCALLSQIPTLTSAAELERKFPPVSVADLAAIDRALPEKARVAPKQARNLLIFCRCEGFVHSAIPHGNAALSRMGEKTGAYTAEVRDDMAVFNDADLARFDGVAFVNTTQLKFKEPAQRQALMTFLAKGHGLIGIHAATDNFPTWPEAQALIGGIFHSHPWYSKDTVAVKLDEPNHPLVAAFGGKGFWIRDEIYQIVGDYSRSNQRVLLSLDMSKPQNQRGDDPKKPGKKIIVRTDNDFPISWIKQTDNGIRVFYSSLGHREDVFRVPEVMQSYLDGIQFALGDLAADAAPSAKISPAAIPALAPEVPLALQDRH